MDVYDCMMNYRDMYITSYRNSYILLTLTTRFNKFRSESADVDEAKEFPSELFHDCELYMDKFIDDGDETNFMKLFELCISLFFPRYSIINRVIEKFTVDNVLKILAQYYIMRSIWFVIALVRGEQKIIDFFKPYDAYDNFENVMQYIEGLTESYYYPGFFDDEIEYIEHMRARFK